MICECGCSSDAPAASPWFLKTRMYLKRRSCFRSSILSRKAHSISSTRFNGMVVSVSPWSGVSITTSCAPTPFILSNIPSACRSRSPLMPSAGNLLGTTRRFHPIVWGCTFSPGREANISGGVVLSLPGQNGQNPPFIVTRSREKSPGRLERSVEMITHRPVTGSFLSSGTITILQLSRFAAKIAAGGARRAWCLLQFRFASSTLQYAFRHGGRICPRREQHRPYVRLRPHRLRLRPYRQFPHFCRRRYSPALSAPERLQTPARHEYH